jgi:hypothetical protein
MPRMVLYRLCEPHLHEALFFSRKHRATQHNLAYSIQHRLTSGDPRWMRMNTYFEIAASTLGARPCLQSGWLKTLRRCSHCISTNDAFSVWNQTRKATRHSKAHGMRFRMSCRVVVARACALCYQRLSAGRLCLGDATWGHQLVCDLGQISTCSSPHPTLSLWFRGARQKYQRQCAYWANIGACTKNALEGHTDQVWEHLGCRLQS